MEELRIGSIFLLNASSLVDNGGEAAASILALSMPLNYNPQTCYKMQAQFFQKNIVGAKNVLENKN